MEMLHDGIYRLPLRLDDPILYDMLHRLSLPLPPPSLRWRCRAGPSAKETVGKGLVALSKSDPIAAKELFEQALEMQPTDQEAGAAAYNIACCYVEMKEYQKAADQVVRAVNDYRLDISIPKSDVDLEVLRRRPEWEEALGKMRGGLTSNQRLNMISELRSPFRLFRFWIFGGLSIGAGVGLIFITANLVKAIADESPLDDPIRNLGINVVALGIFSVLFFRDYQSLERSKAKIEREESLSKLQVEKSAGKAIPLNDLRGTYRPVIVSGSKSFCKKSLESARSYASSLKERGIVVIPVTMSEMDASLKALKEEFTSSTTGFGEIQQSEAKLEGRFELKAFDVTSWTKWLTEQKELSGVEDRDFYLQVMLDGRVRSSGSGLPPWGQIVSDVPPLDDIRTKFTDNIGF